VIGTVIVVAANRLKRCMARKGSCLPIVAGKGIEGRRDRRVPKPIRAGGYLGAPAELIADEMIHAGPRDTVAPAVMREVDEKRCIRCRAAAVLESCRKRLPGVLR
jgi:hypothetical protein